MTKGILFDFGDTLVVEPTDYSLPINECELTLLDGAEHVIPALADRFTLVVVSNTFNSGDDVIRDALARVGLAEHFSAVVTSVTVGSAKPEPAIYLEALRRAQLSVDETVMVGDRLDTDILGASRLGMTSFHLSWKPPRTDAPAHPEHPPTFTVGSLTALMDHPFLTAS